MQDFDHVVVLVLQGCDRMIYRSNPWRSPYGLVMEKSIPQVIDVLQALHHQAYVDPRRRAIEHLLEVVLRPDESLGIGGVSILRVQHVSPESEHESAHDIIRIHRPARDFGGRQALGLGDHVLAGFCGRQEVVPGGPIQLLGDVVVDLVAKRDLDELQRDVEMLADVIEQEMRPGRVLCQGMTQRRQVGRQARLSQLVNDSRVFHHHPLQLFRKRNRIHALTWRIRSPRPSL